MDSFIKSTWKGLRDLLLFAGALGFDAVVAALTDLPTVSGYLKDAPAVVQAGLPALVLSVRIAADQFKHRYLKGQS